MSNSHNDIDLLIKEIEHIKTNLDDPSLGSVFWEEAMKDFISRHSGALLGLLDELKHLREKAGRHSLSDDTHRVIVEGYSDKNAAAALSDALDKASGYFSEQRDISITLQQLIELPKGGHRATLEIHITPMTLKDRCHPQAMDVEIKRINDHDFASRKKFSENHLGHLVFDHFAATTGGGFMPVPDYFLINVNDACLMNNMIEKQFFKAGHMDIPGADNTPSLDPVRPQHILVRVKPTGEAPEPQFKKRNS